MSTEKQLQKVRKRIDGVDKQIVKHVSKRLRLAILAGEIKHKSGIKFEDRKRIKEVIKNVAKESKKQKINPKVTKEIYRLLLKKFLQEQKMIGGNYIDGEKIRV